MLPSRLNKVRLVFPVIALLFFSVGALAQSPDVSASSAAGTSEEPGLNQRQWVRQIESDLINEKFDDLDQMADQYRREKSRLPGGDWKLRIFYGILDAPQQTDKDSRDHLAHLEHWMQSRPKSVTARVALSTSLVRWAWVARGHGLANTVTPEGWRLFNERVKEAQTVLEGSANMDPMCPQWYSQMMAVALTQGWDNNQMKALFDRAARAEPDYFYIYVQYANYLLPKWEGQPGDSAAFAKTSADTLGGTPGDILYFQIATILIKRGDGDFPVKQMDWERIQRGYEALTTQYGSSRRTMNQLAFMAYKYKDTAVAGRQFTLIGDQWAPGVWRDRQFFDLARDWAGETR